MLIVSGPIWCAVVVDAFFDLIRRQAFDSPAQHINSSGAHAFIQLGLSNLRGRCPALEAPANHGCTARNGYTTFRSLAMSS